MANGYSNEIRACNRVQRQDQIDKEGVGETRRA
jgi:hypothetical protein